MIRSLVLKFILYFAGEVPDFKKFSKESKSSKERRKRERGAEAQEAEEYAKELGLTDEHNSLTNAIMQRQVSQINGSSSFKKIEAFLGMGKIISVVEVTS